MKKRGIWVAVSVLVVFGLLLGGFGCATPAPTPTPTAPPTTPEKVYEWKMQSMFNTPERTWEAGIVYFADLVNEMSDGRIQIDTFPPGAIVPAYEMGDACGKGVLDIMHFHEGYWVGKDLAFGILGYLPGAFDYYQDLDYWLWGRGGAEIEREMFAPYNIYWLGNTGLDENENLWSKVPIRSFADAKGLSMRSSGIAGSLYEKLGFSIVSMPAGELYDALSKGVVDCGEYGNNTQMKDLSIHEVTKYIISPMIHQMSTNCYVGVNMDRWNELPEDLQAILFAAIRTMSWNQVHALHSDELKVNEWLKGYGMEFIELSPADCEIQMKAAMEVWSESATASPNAKRVLESMVDYLKEIGEVPADYQL